jgi:putative Mn2+ efflux pump MntP
MFTSLELLTTSFVAVGLAADAVAVSLTSGLMIRHIHVNKALKIALFFGGFQAIMPMIGWGIGLTCRDFLASFDHWIAFIILGAIGSKMIYEAVQNDDEEKKFNPLDSYTLIGLAIATSIDALVVGLGLSMIKTPLLLACTIIGSITFALCFIAVFIGHKFGNLFSQKVEILGGLVLILIGSKILIEHLIA